VVALLASIAGAAVILVAWFPAGALIAQRRTLSQSTITLVQLRAEDKALRAESKNLSTPSEIARIARQQFQLIAPGEQAYQILPPPGTTGGATDPYSGDPGNAAPVSPSASAELPPGAVGTNQFLQDAHKAASATKGAVAPSLFGRVLHTLEFWR